MTESWHFVAANVSLPVFAAHVAVEADPTGHSIAARSSQVNTFHYVIEKVLFDVHASSSAPHQLESTSGAQLFQQFQVHWML